VIVDQMERDGRSVIKYKQYGEGSFHTDDRFRPYFYVSAEEGYTLPDGVDGTVRRSVDERATDGTELHKVVLETTYDAREARDGAEDHYEADIPFERRYYIDRVSESIVGEGDIPRRHPDVLHVDIEVWADGGGVDPLEATEPVLSLSCYSPRRGSHTDMLLKPDGWSPAQTVETDGDGREYVEPDWDSTEPGRVYLFDSEVSLLASFCSLVKNTRTEVLTGWNFGGFDAPYLIKRLERVEGISPAALSPLGESYVSSWTTDSGNERINTNIKGVDIFDMMDAYRHLKRRDKPPNWRLETVAEYEGTDVGKMEFDTARVGPVWESDPMSVMEYNRRDAVLTHHIDESMSATDLFMEMHRAFAIPLEDTLNNSVLVEMFVMSRSPDWGKTDRVLDSKRTDTNDFEGGNTKQPNEGLYEWVFSADVTSEYPNWVRAANLSPETVVLEGDEAWGRDDLIDTPHDGIKFLPHDERLGILPMAVDEMFRMKVEKTEKRDAHEYGTDAYEQADMERDATKWFLNSIQGVTGMETHRLSKNEVSAAITSFGRETVEKMVDIGEDAGYEFVYGDTDSAFFHDPTGGSAHDLESSVGAVEALAAETNEALPEWAREEYNIRDSRVENLEVEPEKVAKRAFFPNKKKRYTLWLAWNDGQEVDKIDHTGWAIVRSDTSSVEERVQRKTLEALMHRKGEGYVTERIGEEMRDVVEGEYDPMDMARPQGSSKSFDRYGDNGGTLDFQNVPYFVAAMLSSNELLGTDYKGGDKTWMLPVRETETVELGGTTNGVNYLAIDGDTELPAWVEIDYAKVLDNITGKVDRVYDSLGWDKSALAGHRADALEAARIERVQEDNTTLGAFTS